MNTIIYNMNSENNSTLKYINNHLPDININKQDTDGNSLLINAIQYGKIKLARLLISKKANVDICNDYKQNALMKACSRGYLDIVKLLVENDADISLVDEFGDNALMYALSSRSEYSYEIVKYLIFKEANVNIYNNERQTALMNACSMGYLDIVELLVENNADISLVDKLGDNALMYALSNRLEDSYEIVNYLITLHIEIYIKNVDGDTPLILAIEKNNDNFNKFIDFYLNNNNNNNKISNNINIKNTYGKTALILSVEIGNLNLVEKLCSKGANIDITDDENNNLIIISAIHNDNVSILQYLIKNKKNKKNKKNDKNLSDYINHSNDNGDNALILAVLKDIDINNTNECSNNAVKIEKFIKLLIDNGIDINHTNKNGNNALICAINYDYTSIVKLFLENKNLNINIVNNDNKSIINYFRSNESIKIIKDYVNQKKNNKKICKYIIHFINSYYTPLKISNGTQLSVREDVKKQNKSKYNPFREPSVNIQTQSDGTCFAHAISRCILRLIKKYVPNYFTNKSKEKYIEINNFEKFKVYLKNPNKLDAMYYNNILYYYFYNIITNKYGCNGGNPEIVLSYIINRCLINNYYKNNNISKIMNKHIDNISEILNKFYILTKDISFNIKRYPYIQKYIPDEIKKILDKKLYVILSFRGNNNFFNHFSNIKSSTIEYTNFNSYNNNKKYDGHSVVIKSYEKNSMIITNSWGKKWGFLGYLKLDENIFLNKSCLLPYFLYVDINKKKILKNNINKLPLQNLSLLYNNINKNKYFINLNDNNCDKSINKKKEKDKKYILDKMASIIENNKK